MQFGTHHSKTIIAFYETGVRVAITTANFISPDWRNKNQVSVLLCQSLSQLSSRTCTRGPDYCNSTLAHAFPMINLQVQRSRETY